MATNYTTNYQLNQWEPADAVQRVEFNQDNAKVDAALKALSDQVVQKANQSALNTVISAVNQKADQTDLTAAVSRIGALESGKVDQTALNAVAATIPNIVFGTYTGDGVDGRIISLGFTPKAVLLFAPWGGTHSFDPQDYYLYAGGLALPGCPIRIKREDWDVTFLSIVSGGFQLEYYTSAAHHPLRNERGQKFYSIAFVKLNSPGR